MFVCLSRADLETAGFSDYQIARAAQCCLRKVRRGVYLVSQACKSPEHRFVAGLAAASSTHLPKESSGMKKRDEDLRILVRSFVGDLPPGAVFSHRSALIIHGLPVPYIDWTQKPVVEVVHPENSVRRSGILVRKRSVDEDVIHAEGFAVTSVLRTLFETARDYPTDFAVAAVDAALRRKLVSVAEFADYCSAHPVRTHQTRVNTVAANVDERRESVAESICAVRFVENCIPGFEPQVTIRNEDGCAVARTDFANEQAKVIAEFDGAEKYYLDDPDPDPREAFERERRREYSLRNMGFTVFRLTWQDLFRGDLFLRIKATVRKRLASSRSF